MSALDPFALGGNSAGDDSDAVAAIEFQPCHVPGPEHVEHMLIRLDLGTRAAAQFIAKSKAELVDIAVRSLEAESINLLDWSDEYMADITAVLDLAKVVQARLAIAFTVAAITIDRR